MTDMEVEKEIARLSENEFVKLARAEQRMRYRRRQYLYQLRCYEKKGRELAKAGYTMENIEEMVNACKDDGEEVNINADGT